MPTRYAAASRRHVEHRREHAEEQQRRADVLLVAEHEQRDHPTRAAAGRGHAATGMNHRPTRTRPCVSSSRLSTRYAAKNATSSTLAISLGSNVREPIATHSRSPLIVRPIFGASGRSSAPTPEHRDRVAVALEHAHVAHDDQREHEHADADRDPERLHPRLVRVLGDVEPGDRDEPDAVQQRGERQERGVGVRREPPDREVRDEVEAEHPREQRVEAGRQLGTVGERDEDVAADGDDHDEQTRAKARSGGVWRARGARAMSAGGSSRGVAASSVRSSCAGRSVGAVGGRGGGRGRGGRGDVGLERRDEAAARRTSDPRAAPPATRSWSTWVSCAPLQSAVGCSTVGFQPSTPPGTPLKMTTRLPEKPT